MQDTSLSPRLRHLLIQEDRSTGRLIMPTRSDIRSSISLNDGPLPAPGAGAGLGIGFGNGTPSQTHNQLSPSSRNSSPAMSPTSLSFDSSPNDTKRALPSDVSQHRLALPSPVSSNRRPSSIFSLLNGLSVGGSPPSSASSIGSGIVYANGIGQTREERREDDAKPKIDLSSSSSSFASPYTSTRRLSSAPISPNNEYYPAPYTAPIVTHRQSMYFDSRPIQQQQQHIPPPEQPNFAGSDRPGLLRRHSSHPYEYTSSPSSTSRPTTAYATGPIHEADYAGMGARAPISRTTKACNACRNRKVRCDAGGGDMGPCSRCVESGTTCVYTGAQKKRGPCPGTARQSISKPRRPSTQSQISSHRSSVASVQSYIVTPTDEQAPWSRSSYGFPPAPPTFNLQQKQPDPSEWSSIAPGKGRPSTSTSASTTCMTPARTSNGNGIPHPNGTTVISWSNVSENNMDMNHNGMGMFDRDYALGPRNSIHLHKLAIDPPPPHHHHNLINDSAPRALPPLRVAIDRGGT
ncbi:hypothetical protein I204_00580 [Kwoniella mangroviensis CBS 8886]|uniref:uncharacterized protein n=1 Tax=Kwoniella mangroviensis CBS 8507 TaxID=1296122 RepID=UPI00080CEB56|nr:uncharacterized protein I203_07172 [Kwoniella mangroviensis CBS 8507]OCF63851.1 hypothetical protein I203_07172 [Kwoniella mangroviensis CBS 8507]OCF78638.1 hypothetical protein I204_00580 [Kwoniella mangroviensis CBS 8886]